MSSNTKKSSAKKKDVAPRKETIMAGATVEPKTTTKSVKKEQAKKTRKSKIDEKIEQLIIKDYKDGVSYLEMATKYNSSRGSIYNVLVRNKIIIPQKRKTK